MLDAPIPLPPGAVDRHKMLSVQVLRAFAAISVVLHHAFYDAGTIARTEGAEPFVFERLFDFTFGIHLFFVISGFIMVRTARGFGEPGAPWRFLNRRLLRIAPLYWVATGLVLVGAFFAPTLLNVPVDGWGLALSSFTFIPVARLNGEIRPVLGQGWTLNYEMAFYVVFAAAMIFRRPVGLVVIAISLVGLVCLGKISTLSWPPFMVWTDGLLLEFLVGMGIGLALEAGLTLTLGLAWALGLGGIGLTIVLGPAFGLSNGVDPWLVSGIPAAMILAAAVCGPAWPACSLILPLAVLGDASYSLYLSHPFTIRLLRVAWQQTSLRHGSAPFFVPVAVAMAIVVSLAVYFGLERPMTRGLGAWTRPPS